MGFVDGTNIILKVETAVADTFITVGGMDKFNYNTQRTSTKRPLFGAAAHVTTGARERSFTVSGLVDITDAGQARLRAMELANTPVKIQILWDGTNGFTEEVKATNFTVDGSADGEVEGGFNFDSNAAAVIAGTGPII